MPTLTYCCGSGAPKMSSNPPMSESTQNSRGSVAASSASTRR